MKMRSKPRLFIVALCGFMLVAFAAIALSRGLNVDENQFIASGALLARDGSLPYRDYPYFHTPYLIAFYAPLFLASDYLLLSARLFSVVCAWLSLVLIVRVVWQSLAETNRAFFTACIATLLFASPLVRYSCWRAWNHPLSTLFAIASVLSLWRAFHDMTRSRWFCAGGFLLSLAVGTRLSFAPLALAFAAVTFFAQREITLRQRIQNLSLLALGGLLGSLPLLAIFLLDPRAFIFDNFTWNGPINALYRGAAKHFSTGDKLLYALKTMASPGNLALLLLFIGLQWFALRQREFRRDCRNLLILAALPCLLLGALAPPVPYDQYFYALVPFLVFGAIQPALYLMESGRSKHVRGAFALAAAISLLSTCGDLRYLPNLATPSRWVPVRIHHAGVELARIAGAGPVLTLTPIVPLEGELRIYPALVTGPFAWKTAKYLSEDQRREFGLIGPLNLTQSLQSPAAGAVCIGRGDESRKVLLDYAASLGYRPVRLSDGETAWVP